MMTMAEESCQSHHSLRLVGPIAVVHLRHLNATGAASIRACQQRYRQPICARFRSSKDLLPASLRIYLLRMSLTPAPGLPFQESGACNGLLTDDGVWINK